MVGPEAYKVFKSMRSKEGNETPEHAYKLLTDHFSARRSEFAEEQKFRHIHRRDGERLCNETGTASSPLQLRRSS